jgi:urease accessory protein
MALLAPPPRPAADPIQGTVPRGWTGQLRLRYVRDAGRTRLAAREHRGPLTIQRPFYPEGPAVSHTYLLHPPGGIVGGDELHLEVEAGNGAHALLTTPAATKLYRSAGANASVQQAFRVERASMLEWLPQEVIAYDGSRATLATRVDLTEDARFIGWETLALGRPAAGEAFEQGRLTQTLDIQRDGRPLLRERLELTGSDPLLRAPWGLAGHVVVSTLVAVGPPARLDAVLGPLRECFAERPGAVAASDLGGLLVVRGLHQRTRDATSTLIDTWRLLRPALSDRPARPPRIWAT